jgi:organic hydroperoxide reductase OsmC/OhrA
VYRPGFFYLMPDPLLNNARCKGAESMDQEHKSKVVAWWCSGSTGITKCDSAPTSIHFTAPVSRGGLEGRWAPEELLLASLASCFATTFRGFAEQSSLVYTRLQVEVEGVVHTVGLQPSLDQVLVRAFLTLPTDNHHEVATGLLNRTLAECEVSRALTVHPTLEQAVMVNGVAVA